MSQRHRARRLALQGLCCLDARGNQAWAAAESFIAESREPEGTIKSAQSLLIETFDDLEAIDAILIRHARHWELARLALVDRNILRIATNELKSESAPFKVVISEAIKLAQEFSTAESPRFVNGVLDAVAKELQAERNAT